MECAPECIPCAVKQAIRTARIAGVDEARQKLVAMAAMREVSNLNPNQTPAFLATKAIRAGESIYDSDDPFVEIKKRTTEEALQMCRAISEGVIEQTSNLSPAERIRYMAKLAAVGNIIDFGVGSEFDLEKTLKETFEKGFAIDNSDRFYQEIRSGESFLLISDNAGEIVFDRFLLDEISRMGKRVIVSVKSRGILNDATREDALMAGIKEPIEIVETGSGSLGIIFDECSDEFKRVFESVDVVLSKGQANYETLDEVDRRIFYILRAKCPIVASRMNVPTGSSVFLWNGK